MHKGRPQYVEEFSELLFDVIKPTDRCENSRHEKIAAGPWRSLLRLGTSDVSLPSRARRQRIAAARASSGRRMQKTTARGAALARCFIGARSPLGFAHEGRVDRRSVKSPENYYTFSTWKPRSTHAQTVLSFLTKKGRKKKKKNSIAPETAFSSTSR